MQPFLAFIISPLNGDEGLWMAELTPDGTLAGHTFSNLSGTSLTLKPDQVALVSYDSNADEVSFSIINTWTVRPNWLAHIPEKFIPKWLAKRTLRKAYKSGVISKVFGFLYQTYLKEKEALPVLGKASSEETGVTASPPETN